VPNVHCFATRFLHRVSKRSIVQSSLYHRTFLDKRWLFFFYGLEKEAWKKATLIAPSSFLAPALTDKTVLTIPASLDLKMKNKQKFNLQE
jgi:hypothetical protein